MSRLLAALLLTAACATAAHAQRPPRAAADAPAATAPATQPERLPAPSITHHSVTLADGRALAFTATAGALRSTDSEGKAEYEIATIAYTLDGADPATRPVAFVFNGGPGSASAWLQLGMLGPWRIAMEGDARAPSASPALLPNPQTWLDFTDLVFIDPVGAGFSRFIDTSEGLRRRVWSVDGDVDAMADAIQRWIATNERAVSPKYIVGESYGGIRGPRVVRSLQSGQGIGISGLVLVSPTLDMSGRSGGLDPLSWVERLPTEVAVARAAHGPVDRASLADAEAYATGDYLHDLIRGDSDPAAVARMVDRVTALTGLDPALVRNRGGRIDGGTFVRELYRASNETGSIYDATEREPDPFPDATFSQHPDPVTDALTAPVASAMLDLYGRTLKWLPDRPYHLIDHDAGRNWDFGRNRPESATTLRTALAVDRHFRVLIGAGLYDVVVPYFGTQMILDQFPPAIGGDRVRLTVLPGGHMFYTRDASRLAFRDAAKALYRAE
ncbi:MAG TPA: peptidase S10 [Acetobacteraceae bacterium]|nr:peptidase S10 [Acetobacteraceae bacterium]